MQIHSGRSAETLFRLQSRGKRCYVFVNYYLALSLCQ
ncbi:hypothetical protein T06_12227, partial [Trichinella sp. T6]